MPLTPKGPTPAASSTACSHAVATYSAATHRHQHHQHHQMSLLRVFFGISLCCMLLFGVYSWLVLGINVRSLPTANFLRQLPLKQALHSHLNQKDASFSSLQASSSSSSLRNVDSDAITRDETVDTRRAHEISRASSQGLLDPHRFELPTFQSVPLNKSEEDLKLEAKINESCVHLDHVEKSFEKPDKCISRQQLREVIIDLVFTTTSVFASYGIATFLESGTLLGSYRHQTIIPYDVDADLGIDEIGFEILKSSVIEFPSPKYFLEVFEGKFHPTSTRFAELPARVIDRDTGLFVDIFVYKDWPDEVFEDPSGNTTTEQKEPAKPLVGPLPSGCYISCVKCPRLNDPSEEYVMKQFHIPYDWMYPLEDCAFAGKMLKCPRQARKYLDYMFGPDFMKPVPFYVAFNQDGTAVEAEPQPKRTEAESTA